MWRTRPDTNDAGIIDQVYTNNSCYIPIDLTGWVFIDIGAHIGAASVLASQRGAVVYAYEPCYENYMLLRQNLYSCTAHWWATFNVGVGELGVYDLYIDPHNTGQCSVYPDLFPELLAPSATHYKVAFVSLEHVLKIDMRHSRGKPVFLKVDCEGGEYVILDELLHIDNDYLPKLIHVEFHRKERDALERLLNIGYRYEQLSPDAYMLTYTGVPG